MYAMILAAGLGTRLGSLSSERPKPMLPVLDQPLVRWTARYAAFHGLRHGIVNLHHLGEQIEGELSADGDEIPELCFSHEAPEVLGTGGGIREMARRMPAEPFVVLNAKIVCDLDLSAALATHKKRGALATMVLFDVPDVELWGAVGIDDDQRVVELVRHRRGSGSQPGDPSGPATARYMFTGIHILEPEVVDAIDASGPCCIIQTAYARLLERDDAVFAHVHRGYFHEHSTPGRYLAGNFRLLDGALDAAGLARAGAPAVEIVDSVLLGRDVRIAEGARLGARVVVGAGAEVGARAELEDCVVWPGARALGKHGRCVVTPNGVLEVDADTIGSARHERR